MEPLDALKELGLDEPFNVDLSDDDEVNSDELDDLFSDIQPQVLQQGLATMGGENSEKVVISDDINSDPLEDLQFEIERDIAGWMENNQAVAFEYQEPAQYNQSGSSKSKEQSIDQSQAQQEEYDAMRELGLDIEQYEVKQDEDDTFKELGIDIESYDIQQDEGEQMLGLGGQQYQGTLNTDEIEALKALGIDVFGPTEEEKNEAPLPEKSVKKVKDIVIPEYDDNTYVTPIKTQQTPKAKKKKTENASQMPKSPRENKQSPKAKLIPKKPKPAQEAQQSPLKQSPPQQNRTLKASIVTKSSDYLQLYRNHLTSITSPQSTIPEITLSKSPSKATTIFSQAQTESNARARQQEYSSKLALYRRKPNNFKPTTSDHIGKALYSRGQHFVDYKISKSEQIFKDAHKFKPDINPKSEELIKNSKRRKPLYPTKEELTEEQEAIIEVPETSQSVPKSRPPKKPLLPFLERNYNHQLEKFKSRIKAPVPQRDVVTPEYTFRPNLNQNTDNLLKKKRETLYERAKLQKEMREKKAQEALSARQARELLECSFRPNLNDSLGKIVRKKVKKNKSMFERDDAYSRRGTQTSRDQQS